MSLLRWIWQLEVAKIPIKNLASFILRIITVLSLIRIKALECKVLLSNKNMRGKINKSKSTDVCDFCRKWKARKYGVRIICCFQLFSSKVQANEPFFFPTFKASSNFTYYCIHPPSTITAFRTLYPIVISTFLTSQQSVVCSSVQTEHSSLFLNLFSQNFGKLKEK